MNRSYSVNYVPKNSYKQENNHIHTILVQLCAKLLSDLTKLELDQKLGKLFCCRHKGILQV